MLPHINIEILQFLLAFIAVSFGLYQYYRAQRWKTSEFVASEMTALFAKPSTRAACRMLDWTIGTVAIESPHANDTLKSVKFTRALVMKSLDTGPLANNYDIDEITKCNLDDFTPDEEAIRCTMDNFFSSLERLNGYIDRRNKLFEADQLEPYLIYYLRIINRNDLFGQALRNYIEEYRYPGVMKITSKILETPWRTVSERRVKQLHLLE